MKTAACVLVHPSTRISSAWRASSCVESCVWFEPLSCQSVWRHRWCPLVADGGRVGHGRTAVGTWKMNVVDGWSRYALRDMERFSALSVSTLS